MAPRALWKGHLKIGAFVCAVSLHAAASTAERVTLHVVNRKTGHRVRRVFVDSETGKDVPREDQVKGTETKSGDTVMLEAAEIAEALPESDKTLDVEAFIDCDQIDDLYFDRPYYLTPGDAGAGKAYAVLRDGLRKQAVAALATAVLFRRTRVVLIRSHEQGLIATTLNPDFEIRSEEEAFEGIPTKRIGGEMLELAQHIIKTKSGKFDPSKFDDRYETALVALARAKLAGKEIKPRKEAAPAKVVDLMEALRQSAGRKSAGRKSAGQKAPTRKAAPKKAAPRAKTTRKKVA